MLCHDGTEPGIDVQRGFPLELLELVRCPIDRGRLRADAGLADDSLPEGTVRCETCTHVYHIRDGVLSLLDSGQLHPESAAEMRVRDQRNDSILDGSRGEWRSTTTDEIEIRPTLETMGGTHGMDVCELGCGPGRYTVALAREAARVMAVDFSLSGLLVLRLKLEPAARVALVHADVTRPYGAQASFDRVLSTLHSNLPDRVHRAASLREMACVLKDNGRAVVSMHHYSVRDLMARVPVSGRYADSGIFRYYMTARESVEEASLFFERLRHRHIAASIPGLRNASVSRAVARIPLMRSALGRLLLAVGEQPRRHRAVEIPQCA